MIKQALKKVAGKIPLSVYTTIIKRDILGLYYHVVSDEELPHIRHLYPYKTPEMFENDLYYLKKNFNMITYDELDAYVTEGRKLKPRSMILTFDDGFSECTSIVRPLLLKHGIPCVFFIPTDYINNHGMSSDLKTSLCLEQINAMAFDSMKELIKSVNDTFCKEFTRGSDLIQWVKSTATNDHTTVNHLCRLLDIDLEDYLIKTHPYITTEDVERLVSDGFSIGAHSTGHEKFSLLSDSEIEMNICASSKAIGLVTGKSRIPFAFPYTADGVPRDLLEEIRNRYNDIGLFFDTNGIRNDKKFIISRICGDSPKIIKNGLSNLNSFLTKAYVEEVARWVY